MSRSERSELCLNSLAQTTTVREAKGMRARGEAGVPWPPSHGTLVQLKKKIPFEIANYEEYFEIILIKYLTK